MSTSILACPFFCSLVRRIYCDRPSLAMMQYFLSLCAVSDSLALLSFYAFSLFFSFGYSYRFSAVILCWCRFTRCHFIGFVLVVCPCLLVVLLFLQFSCTVICIPVD